MPTIPVKQIERNRRKIAEPDHVSVPPQPTDLRVYEAVCCFTLGGAT
jgi:hypothetical protein